MAKAPAFQFYVRDWLSDPQLKMASHQSKGIWIDLLCYMWESPDRGELSGTVKDFCRMLGTTENEFTQFLDETKRLNFASVTEGNGKVTVQNRRMAREEKERKNNALRQARYKSNAKSNIEGNEKVTPISSSSSSKRVLKCRVDTLPPYQEIISYLNQKANTHFKHDTTATKRFIKARWNEGFDLSAFKYVIDVKCSQWLTDPHMLPYIRPQTLFGTKFESYLNEVLRE